jgi:hypothetical protein
MNDWIQTKKETKTLDGDNIISTTEEPNLKKRFAQETKDLVDIVVKILGATSIFIPLFLLYFQYSHEVIKKRNEELSQIYIDVSFDIQAAKNYQFSLPHFKSASENLLFKYPAKIAVFKIDSLNYYYQKVLTVFEYYEAIKYISIQLEFISSGYQNIYNNHSVSYKAINGVTKEFKLEFLDMSKAEKIKQIEKYLIFFNDSVDVSNGNLLNKLYEIPKIYLKDTLLSKIGLYCDTAYENYNDLHDELIELRAYLTNKSQEYVEDYYLDRDASNLNSISNLMAMLKHIHDCKSRLEEFLDDSRQKFQNEVLQFIKD